MSVYHGKILELVAIEKSNEKSYLRIKLSFEQEDELFWEIDSNTAENLKTISVFDENHKYRLSLHTTLDTIKKQYISYMTRTYREKSERIYFACSADYKNNLDSIKNTQSVNDFENLPFLSAKLSAIEEKKVEEKSEVVIPKGYKLPFKWVSVVMICLIFSILFGYSNHSNLNEPAINKNTIPIAEAKTVDVNEVNNNNVVTPAANLVEDESSPPYIKLDESIAYSLPEGNVALTFDDGPSKYTVEIVDILKKYKVGGTFFFIGTNAKKRPDDVRYVQSNKYSIGSHSMNHLIMSDLSYEKQENEFIQGNKVIEDITNDKVTLFRPPYAAFNDQTKNAVNHHQNKIVLWNRDTEDWKSRDADKIFHYIRNTESSGSIILLHESQAVIDALPKIIEHLQAQNLKIVSLQ
ncbi:polysaccharide deacetylase family protein [Cytobacillus dafuensis]|uniref:Polysaccharide deacetylase family protein n=1 Tax=Cytobacillus dafuensis TaxID=1742359 RepID=A0A5B8ZED6_CYTDA|nr:polysaccharide deacetylase family protein [Cytobacillus dafuensis]QED49866.1 polysaccharide deacetylase family protein [Cytobacillus dafuensis]